MNSTLETTSPATVHPFLEAGMGEGPYAYVGNYDLSEAMNPDSAANFGNMTGFLSEAPKLKAGMGTCACCGMTIMNICIIRDGAGDLWGVGTDCVEKTGDAGIAKKALAASALRSKAKRRAEAAKRAVAKFEAGRPAREQAQREWAEKEAVRKAELDAAKLSRLSKLSPDYRHAITRLSEGSDGDFYRSLASQLLEDGSLSPRQVHFLAKAFGRDGSKAYTAAYDEISAVSL
jgi:hypothetical protein